MPKKDTYFELTFKGPWKGINVDMPSNMIDPSQSPSFLNFILKNGEIRTRPRQEFFIPAPQVGGQAINTPINGLSFFKDANGVTHTVLLNNKGLWQLNSRWRKNPTKAWSLVGPFTQNPGLNIPITNATYLNRFFWSNGGNNLWSWDGISSVGSISRWAKSTTYQLNTKIIDSNGNSQIAVQAGKSGGSEPVWSTGLGTNTTDSGVVWINNGIPGPQNGFESVAVVDATNGITAGAFFLGELNFHLLMLYTVEGTELGGVPYPQRVRWTPSGFYNIWDPNVNIGAGYNDMIDVPDAITGFFTIGRNGFIFRENGITELSSIASGTNPFDFNHLWASDKGIGNVFPFSIDSYGPIGMFIAEDDVYNMTLGGFKRVGGVARDAIFNDLAAMTGTPVAAIVPKVARNFIYPCYKLYIPFGQGTKVWSYAIDDNSWQSDFYQTLNVTGRPRFVPTF